MQASEPPAAPAERRYRILVELGHGGTSDVYLAVAQGAAGFNKLVVLKALKRSIAVDRASRRMFLAEARLSARLNHPNVVQVNEVLEQDGIPVIVMEYLEGRALSQILRSAWDKLPLRQHLKILAEALHGLNYSHELCDFDGTPLDVVHRDMSPHNVFVTFDGSVKVLDFGLAKVGGADTHTGTVRGKLHYMAPEQLSGSHSLDRRADIYAVGVMLWEAATGTRMWAGLPDPVVMKRVLAGEVPSVRTVRAGLHPRLAAACERALALAPAERFQSAAEMGDELESLLAELDTTTDHRGLHHFMKREFGELRQSMRKVVEEKLNEESIAEGSASIRLTSGTESVLTRGTFAATTKTITNLPTQRASRGSYLLASGVGVCLLAAGVIAGPYIVGGGDGAPPPAAQAPSAAGSSPTLQAVLLRVTAFPATATVFLDGKALPGNPCAESRPYDTKTHVLRVEAPGHQPLEQRIQLTSDLDLLLTLKSVTAAPTGTPTRTPRAREAAKPVATQVSCSPPYFIDARGIKKYKPECL